MQDTVQPVLSKRRKYDVYVIGHNAPRKELVARAAKMLNRISYNFGDTRIPHVALAWTAIKAALRSSKQALRFAWTGAIGG